MDSSKTDSGDAPLGTITSIVAAELGPFVKSTRKWERQAAVKRLLPDERCAFCLSKLFGNSMGAAVMYSPAKERAYFGNLPVCGSVWMCPVCSSKISSARREELDEATSRWAFLGGSVFMATYTVSHGPWDSLEELVEFMKLSYRRMTQAYGYREVREKFGIAFYVRALEVTWSEGDGWHPHMHVLYFVMPDSGTPKQLEKELYRCWEKAAAHFGLSMTREHGVRVDQAHDRVADYVAKFGREPETPAWGAADELTRWQLKGGKLAGDGDVHFSPFQLVDALLETGEAKYGDLFREFALTMKGRNQLVWSPGMRAALSMGAPAEDEELALEHELDAFLLAMISPEEWQAVRFYEQRGQVLEIASRGHAAPLLVFVRRLLDRYRVVHGLKP